MVGVKRGEIHSRPAEQRVATRTKEICQTAPSITRAGDGHICLCASVTPTMRSLTTHCAGTTKAP